MPDTKNVHEQLAALQQAYLQQLPGRLREVEDLWQALCDGVGGTAEQLYHLAHKLCGSGPTFGLDEVASGLGLVEHVARRIMHEGGAPSEEDRRRVREDLNSLRRKVAVAQARLALHGTRRLEALEAPAYNPCAGARILLAEDDEMTRSLLANGLRQAGFVVETAENGLMALIQARRERPAAILMDYRMPVMDGVEAVRQMREDKALKEVPVFLITTYSTVSDVRALLNTSVDGFLTKPIDMQDALRQLQEVLVPDVKGGTGSEQRVLIVDDDPLFRKQAALLLQQAGYETVEAENGMAGLRKAEQVHPALVLMDVMMPVMDGFDATEHLRRSATCRDVPIILLTNRVKNPDVTRALQAGADSYIAKPQVTASLVDKVQAILQVA